MNLLLSLLLSILPPQKDETHVDRIAISNGVMAIINDDEVTEVHFQPVMLTRKVRKWYLHSRVYDVHVITVRDYYNHLRTYTTTRFDE